MRLPIQATKNYVLKMLLVTKKTSELVPTPYVEFGYLVEPTTEEIKEAVDNGRLEHRGMDEHQEEIKAWLIAGSKNGQDIMASVSMMKTYHTRRVAFFVVNGIPENDKHPITVRQNNIVTAGNHRLRAAIYLEIPELEVHVTEE